MDTTGPLLSFFLYHRSMRNGADRLAKALATADRASTFAPWFAHYRQACILHAAGEDGVLWPALATARGDVAPLIADMDAEHDELDGVLAELEAALVDDRLDDARRLTDRLVTVVQRHLDHEEADAVPLVVASLGDHLPDVVREIQQSAGPEGASVAIPFFLEQATDEERSAFLAAVPPPVREGYEGAWRDAYGQLVAVLGSA